MCPERQQFDFNEFQFNEFQLEETVRIPVFKPQIFVFALVSLLAAACAPTIHLKVDPIQIYAKLDADVRVRLDQELRDLLQENPNLF